MASAERMLLDVAIMALTAIVGLRFLVVGMRAMNAAQVAPVSPPVQVPAPQPAMIGPGLPPYPPAQPMPPLPSPKQPRQASMGAVPDLPPHRGQLLRQRRPDHRPPVLNGLVPTV